jgi:LppX_LprAFG lipoprotein
MTFRRAAIAMSSTALIVIAGCGSASDTGDSASDTDLPGDAGALTLANFASTTSQAQEDAHTVHLDADVGIQGQTMTMSGDIEVGASIPDTSFAFDLDADDLGDMSMVLVDEVLYLNGGEATDDKFIELDLRDRSNPIGDLYSQLAGQTDPASITRGFQGAIEDFETVGSEEIDGTATTHYRITVDARKALENALGDAMPPNLESSLGSLPETMTYDVWVDEDNLPRQMQFDMMGTRMDLDFSKWGEPVDIEAPSPSEISDQDPMSLLSPSPTS